MAGVRETVRVRNRDIIPLARVLYVMQDVYATERKRLWQEDRLYNITAKLTGMPQAHGGSGGLEGAFGEISAMNEQYREECAEYVEALKAAEAILNAIPSRTMRTFVTLKYLLDLPDREIMSRLNMRRRAYDSARRCIEGAEDMAHVRWKERYALIDAKAADSAAGEER